MTNTHIMQTSSRPIIEYIPDFLDYLDIEKGLSSKTQMNYERFLRKFSDWLDQEKLSKLFPHELTSDNVWQYKVYLSRQSINKKTGNELKKSTQNYYLIALRSLLNYFADKDIQALPADKIKLAKDKKEKLVHFLNLEQISKLLSTPMTQNVIGLRDRALLEVLFSTGLRVAELVSLNRDQIKIQPNMDILEVSIIGKGGRARIVYFSQHALRWVAKYLKTRTDDEEALFINYTSAHSPTTSKRLTVRSVDNIVKKYTKLAGIPVMTTPHTLRHSYATDLLNQGVDLRMVQEFLGHRNIATTQIYTHVTNKKLRDVYLKYHGGKDLGK